MAVAWFLSVAVAFQLTALLRRSSTMGRAGCHCAVWPNTRVTRMKYTLPLILLLLCTVMSGCASDDCEASCEKTKNCTAAVSFSSDCASTCDLLRSAPTCLSEYEALWTCQTNATTDVCSADTCKAESAALGACSSSS